MTATRINPYATYVSKGYASKSVANSTYVDVNSVELGAGTWLVFAHVEYSSNATGHRRCKISVGSASDTCALPATNGFSTGVNHFHVFTLGGNATVSVFAWQNSGGNLTCYAKIVAIRLA